jgi:hypothetical protein
VEQTPKATVDCIADFDVALGGAGPCASFSRLSVVFRFRQGVASPASFHD